MKRTVVMVVLLMIAAALPVRAGVECYQYIDSRAYSDWQYNFCWLSGAICYQCVDAARGAGCSNTWSTCNPDPSGDPYQMASACSPGSVPANPVARAPRTRVERVARLKTGQLL